MDKISFRNTQLYIISLLFCFIFYHLIIDRCTIEIELEVDSPSYLQVFWANKKEGFSENRMSSIYVHPKKHHYSLNLEDLKDIHSLRIDPRNSKGLVKIRYIKLKEQGFQTIVLRTADDFSQLTPNKQIQDVTISNDLLQFKASGKDPYFEYHPQPQKCLANWFAIIFQLLLVFAVSLLFLRATLKGAEYYNFVSILLAAITVAALIMALLTTHNSHPDEYVHVSAGKYYQDHWLPPAADDPAIAHTYSNYGFSRLNNFEIYYLIAGKVERLISAVFNFPNPLLSARAVNLLMLTAILIISINSLYARILALPLLISPQIWYIFSYSNSDAFAVFICFLISYELVKPDSIFYRSLKRPMVASNYFFMLYPTLLLSMFWLSKLNFYPFIGFAFCFLVFRALYNRDTFPLNRQIFIRFFTILILSGIIAGGAVVSHHYVNNFNRSQKIAEMVELHARERFKPSTPLEKQNFSLSLKKRGVTLNALKDQYHWVRDTFQSSFGVYGYLSTKSPSLHYDLVKALGTALAVYIFIAVCMSWNGEWFANTLSLLLFSALIYGLSLYHSWVKDFQPQGRYLFCIFPMAGMLLALVHEKIDRTYLFAGVCSMAVLGLISFIGSGILHTHLITF
jgi:hypothetical protein